MRDADTDALLEGLRRGDESAAAELLPIVYDELRKIAASLLARERPDHTLQATALVHEAWVRVVGHRKTDSDDEEARRHFVRLAVRAMRHALADHARHRGREKRGGALYRVVFPLAVPAIHTDPGMVLDLESALEGIRERSPRIADLAELRVFGGLEMREAAAILGISLATAKIDWKLARAMLSKHLHDDEDPSAT